MDYNPLIMVLDVDRIAEAKSWVIRLQGLVGLFKIGPQLFLPEGPRAVEMVHQLGGKVFLDLKFHDIPRTVEAAARSCVRLGVAMFNVHAAGGPDMLKAAVLGAADEAEKLKVAPPVVLAVTVLTSLDDQALRQIGFPRSAQELVLHLCDLAHQAGINGVVASPMEAQAIRKLYQPPFIIVTPGIRPPGAQADDQKRIATPAAAIAAGADYIVVGRPILKAPDPVAAARYILAAASEARKRRA